MLKIYPTLVFSNYQVHVIILIKLNGVILKKMLNKKINIMKLESIKLDKFKDNVLKKEQMFMLNGNGIATPGGNICAPHGPEGRVMNFDYGYDAIRDGSLTFHSRKHVMDICLQT